MGIRETWKEFKDYWRYGTTGPSIWKAAEMDVALGPCFDVECAEKIATDLHPDILIDEPWERHCLEHPLAEGEVINLSRLNLPASFSDSL